MQRIIIGDKEYQFSYDKFDMLFLNWKPEEHDGMSFQKFLYENLHITKDSLYNYRNRRNGMDKENIEMLTKLLGIPVTDLLEEKTMKGRNVIMINGKSDNNYDMISDFSKSKIYETMTAIEECIFAFFAVFDVEEEFFEVTETLRRNSIAIPDDILYEIEYFVYEDLDNLVNNPDAIFEQLPPESTTLEGIRARNAKLIEIQDNFMEEYLNPLKSEVKKYIITP